MADHTEQRVWDPDARDPWPAERLVRGPSLEPGWLLVAAGLALVVLARLAGLC